jgi:hypothetical protein
MQLKDIFLAGFWVVTVVLVAIAMSGAKLDSFSARWPYVVFALDSARAARLAIANPGPRFPEGGAAAVRWVVATSPPALPDPPAETPALRPNDLANVIASDRRRSKTGAARTSEAKGGGHVLPSDRR